LPADAQAVQKARRRPVRGLLAGLVVIAALVALANIPTTTDQGVDFVVTRHSLPLYVKALDFVDRDIHYRRQAAEITAGANTDELKARAVFDWTRANIRRQPPGYPAIDDHIWHIIVRGYGQSDQQADVFTTLLSYAGVPAYFIFIGPRSNQELSLSLVKIDGRWRVADVENNMMFRSRNGQWATAEDVAADPAFAAAQGPAIYQGVPYASVFDGFHAPIPPDLTRADMQVPGARTWFQLRQLFRPGLRGWDMRPPSRRARTDQNGGTR
jgi:hypothetical protein